MAIRPKAECCERLKLISGQGFSQSVAAGTQVNNGGIEGCSETESRKRAIQRKHHNPKRGHF
jgi:hypothetical protein